MKEHVKYESVAGAGKTTRLMKDIKDLKGRVLLITFSQALQKESAFLEATIPGIRVVTFHALAKGALEYKYGRKIKPSSGLYASTLVRKMGFKPAEAESMLTALNDYCHTRLTMKEFLVYAEVNQDYRVATGITPDLLKLFPRVWEKLMEDGIITHDIYLKLFQLTNPIIQSEYIIIDEFQDFSDAMIDIVEKNSERSSIILAGDAMQRIYEWRGASGMFDIDFGKKEVLSSSWRCPKEIVELANPYTVFLSGIRMESNKEGSGKVTVVESALDFFEGDDVEKQDFTLLARTNKSIFSIIGKLSDKRCNVALDKAISLNGVRDHWNWLNGLETESGLFSKFLPQKREGLFEFYEKNGDEERKEELRAAEKIKNFSAFESVVKRKVPGWPTLTIMTAFKAKGLGFDNVIIADDFSGPKGVSGGHNVLIEEDLKLIYVAITRAKESIVIPRSLDLRSGFSINAKINYLKPLENEKILDKKTRERAAKKMAKNKNDAQKELF